MTATADGNEAAARAALRERQGKGARYDAPSAPAADLALARLGTAYFARKLNELTDPELDAPSLVPGWSRRHIIARVGFQARLLARLAEAARAGQDSETLSEPEAQNEDIHFGATLPAHALRYLFEHSAVHLNVEWRDLDADGWVRQVKTLSGQMVDVSATPWLRARAIWLRAVDLDNGGSFLDFPDAVLDRLLTEARAASPHVLHVLDRDIPPPSGPAITGRAADLLRWITGRGARRLAHSGGRLPPVPLWAPAGAEAI